MKVKQQGIFRPVVLRKNGRILWSSLKLNDILTKFFSIFT